MSIHEHAKLIRLYTDHAPFQAGGAVTLTDNQLHYLRNVMRVAEGQELRLFNAQDGEWLARVSALGKKQGTLELLQQIAPQRASSDIWVLASPVKKEAFDIMVEKASELGAARFMTVICERTVVHRMNVERAKAQATEAAEQCERHDIMQVDDLNDLKQILQGWDAGRKLLFCQERGAAPPILSAIEGQHPWAVLVGPEGGFSDAEISYVTSLPFVIPVSLGERILRAETALIAALACLQAAVDKE